MQYYRKKVSLSTPANSAFPTISQFYRGIPSDGLLCSGDFSCGASLWLWGHAVFRRPLSCTSVDSTVLWSPDVCYNPQLSAYRKWFDLSTGLSHNHRWTIFLTLFFCIYDLLEIMVSAFFETGGNYVILLIIYQQTITRATYIRQVVDHFGSRVLWWQ